MQSKCPSHTNPIIANIRETRLPDFKTRYDDLLADYQKTGEIDANTTRKLHIDLLKAKLVYDMTDKGALIRNSHKDTQYANRVHAMDTAHCDDNHYKQIAKSLKDTTARLSGTYYRTSNRRTELGNLERAIKTAQANAESPPTEKQKDTKGSPPTETPPSP